MKRRPIDEQLVEAVDAVNLDEVHKAIAAGANVNVKVEDEMPLIQLVALRGDADLVKALIDAGANVDARDGDDRTALILNSWVGSSEGQLKALEHLIAAGANVNATDARGRSGLDGAAMFRNPRAAQLLLENGALSKDAWRRVAQRPTDPEDRTR